jgi:hypothetical protein
MPETSLTTGKNPPAAPETLTGHGETIPDE